MEMLDLLEEITDSVLADSLSPIPGFFTLTTIARMVVMRGYEDKGRNGNLSPRQIRIMQNLLEQYFETRRVGRERVYGRRIKRQVT